jgi:hypothetical protein
LSSYFALGTKAKWLLVDGTFLGHEPTSTETANSRNIFGLVKAAHEKDKPVIFTAESLDYLFAAYIWLFKSFYTGPKTRLKRNLYIQNILLKLLATTFEAFIHRRYEQFDPFLKSMLGTSMSNYLESVRIYPFSSDTFPREADGPNDTFCSLDLFDGTNNKIPSDAVVFAIGRIRRETEVLFTSREVIMLDGPDFAFHSTTADVAEIIRSAISRDIHPLIFHNFGGRIRKALRREGIRDSEYLCGPDSAKKFF